MSDLTQLLAAVRDGEQGARDQLYSEVYTHLREIARRHLRGGRDPAQPATTSLVHEAYLRLVRGEAGGYNDRSHFFAVASRAMRQILIDHARARSADKRGGGIEALQLTGIEMAAEERSLELLALDAALAELEVADKVLAELVEMRFFGGLTLEEIALMRGVSERTLKREWRRARAFLYAHVNAHTGLGADSGADGNPHEG